MFRDTNLCNLGKFCIASSTIRQKKRTFAYKLFAKADDLPADENYIKQINYEYET
jgi:hypothetical protein